MVFQASGTRQYFLGIAGQQSGPFSDADVLEKIRNGEIPADALVWYEGLPEWQAISTVEFFREAFAGVPTPPPDATNVPVNAAPRESAPAAAPPRPAAKARAPGTSSARPVTSFAMGTGPSARPVEDEGGGDDKKKILIGVAAAVVIGGAAMFFMGGGGALDAGDPAVGQPKMKFPKAGNAPASASVREETVRKASDDILTKPETAVEALKKIVREKSDDAAGKDALTQLLTYYRQNQRPLEAGAFLMEIKHPAEAVKYFQADPSMTSQSQAEQALFQAYEQAVEPAQKREFLLSDIALLIQPLDKMELAIERIKLFVKAFPGTPHPYAYYLKNNDEKIADIFNKISNYFVSSLLAFTNGEFAELHFDGRPLVEIQREKANQYRIVARYKGKVRLRQDRLDDIHFVFWMIDTNWVVVDTNLTKERQKWSLGNKARYANKFMTADQLLSYEQSIFKAQFPDVPFHETGLALKPKKKTTE